MNDEELARIAALEQQIKELTSNYTDVAELKTHQAEQENRITLLQQDNNDLAILVGALIVALKSSNARIEGAIGSELANQAAYSDKKNSPDMAISRAIQLLKIIVGSDRISQIDRGR